MPFSLSSSSIQTAIKMYKLAGEERFLLWAVCSIQLQVLLAVQYYFSCIYFNLQENSKIRKAETKNYTGQIYKQSVKIYCRENMKDLGFFYYCVDVGTCDQTFGYYS